MSLFNILNPSRLTEVVDIGANPIDGDPPYKFMLEKGLCRVTGFEPQEAALSELNQKKGANERYLPYAIGDGDTHTLNICRASGMTSLLTPDPLKLSLFKELATLSEVLKQVTLPTLRLNDLAEISQIDFLKMDIQGGELQVLRAGRDKLKHTVAIQVEIPFVTLYKDQPSMGEIDLELRALGLMPHCFAAIKKWPISPCIVNNNPRQALNQLLEADLVYVRDISQPEFLTDEQLKHLALIAHHCYQSYDLALHCIWLLEQRLVFASGVQQEYLAVIASKQN